MHVTFMSGMHHWMAKKSLKTFDLALYFQGHNVKLHFAIFAVIYETVMVGSIYDNAFYHFFTSLLNIGKIDLLFQGH